ncbi:ABC transporter substrate-binding protein [Thermostichus vulcanus]|uniref:ABC transporter substrate-binding protein n=1 Tax=Thermostichus vulcanus TaxID=32053 RepID=UPI001FCB869A
MRPLPFLAVLCGVAFALPFVEGSLNPAFAQPSGTLRLYTSQPDADAQQTAAAFQAAYPGVSVEIFRSGTEEVISRFLLEAEAGAPQADVLLVADAPTFELLKSRDLLDPYCSPEAEAIAPTYYDEDCHYFGTKILATVIVYNTALAEPIDSWAALAEVPDGQVVMPSPTYSGAAAYNLGVITRNPALGWNWYEALKDNDAVLVQGNGAVVRNVAAGEQSYGMVVDFLAIRSRNEGSPVDVIYPREGVPLITEPVGIVKGAANLEAAQAFVDFLLSQEGQQVAVDIGYMPLREDVTPPEGFPALSELTVLSAPAAELAETREADKARFSELFGE